MISEELQKAFPAIPEKALSLIISSVSRNLNNSLSSRGIFRPKKVFVKQLGTFVVGGKVDERRLVKRQRKICAKSLRKLYRRRKVETLSGLL